MGKYLDLIRQHEGAQPEAALTPTQGVDKASTVRPGALVSWVRADGTRQMGFVDVLHVDPDGQEWAFVSYGETWAAVNVRDTTEARDVT